MERVDHVHIIEVGSSSLICYVDRMLQREIPDRESLELGISGLDSSFVLMVELAEAYRHLTASRTRRGNHHQRPCGLNIVVLSESFVRIDESHIVRISINGIMIIYLDSQTLKTCSVCICTCLTVIMGYHYAAYEQTDILKLRTQPEHVLVISNTEVTSHLVLFDVKGTDHNKHLCLVP